jgi:transposase
MRDRALAMKWAEKMAVDGSDAVAIAEAFHKRGVKESTVKDQLRRLRKQGLLPALPEESAEKPARKAKPFRPVPKGNKKRKRSKK